jgi:hypothetical protein
MSVIFETLQKLNRPAAAADTAETGDRPRRNTYALKRVLLSPVTVLVLAVVVFGLGYGLVFGLRHLQRQARLDPTMVAAVKVPEPKETATDGATPNGAAPNMAVTEDTDVPPPPELPNLEVSAGKTMTGTDVAETAPAFTGPDVPPPSAAQMAGLRQETATASPVAAWAPPSEAAEDASSQAAGGGSARPGAPLQARGFTPAGGTAAGAAIMAEPPATPRLAARPAFSAVPSRSFESDSGNFQGEAPADPGVTPMATVDRRASAPAINTAVTDRRYLPSTAAAPAGGAAERSVKRTPIPRYTELVHRLQTAVTTGDVQAADRLQSDFAAVKGKEHPYLLKLRAYRCLQAGDFTAAERLLGQVLVLDPSDRDANVNMVVVEAHTGRIDAARRRVARLTELYPEDETLAAMGRRLN